MNKTPNHLAIHLQWWFTLSDSIKSFEKTRYCYNNLLLIDDFNISHIELIYNSYPDLTKLTFNNLFSDDYNFYYCLLSDSSDFMSYGIKSIESRFISSIMNDEDDDVNNHYISSFDFKSIDHGHIGYVFEGPDDLNNTMILDDSEGMLIFSNFIEAIKYFNENCIDDIEYKI